LKSWFNVESEVLYDWRNENDEVVSHATRCYTVCGV
jgi:hypothetical protein